jgi:hypothetical protein
LDRRFGGFQRASEGGTRQTVPIRKATVLILIVSLGCDRVCHENACTINRTIGRPAKIDEENKK